MVNLIAKLKYGKQIAVAPNGNIWFRKEQMYSEKYKKITNTIYNPNKKQVEKVIEQFPETRQTFWRDSNGVLTDEFKHPDIRTTIHKEVGRKIIETVMYNIDNKQLLVCKILKNGMGKHIDTIKKTYEGSLSHIKKLLTEGFKTNNKPYEISME